MTTIRINTQPRILLIIDIKGWAFHKIALGIQSQLSKTFDFDITTLCNKQTNCHSYDLIHTLGLKTNIPNGIKKKVPVIKSIFNLVDWNGIDILPENVYTKLASDATALTVPIIKFFHQTRNAPMPVFLWPEGVDTKIFKAGAKRTGALKVGWAGNPAKAYKRFSWAHQACKAIGTLHVADGTLSEKEIVHFYQNIDVILCTAMQGEGCPRTILEAMSCGCFPVAFPVGVLPEVVHSGINGILVKEENIEALSEQLRWCNENVETIRGKRHLNIELMQEKRDWSCIATCTEQIYRKVLEI